MKLIGYFLVAILIAIPACADVITMSFTSSELYGSPNDMLTFGGTLENSGSPVYINAATVNLEGFDPSALDLSDFLLNVPWTPLADGDSVGPFDFFTVTIPAGFADGEYNGSLIVQGGATMDDDAVLGSATFKVDVGPETSGVPEPAATLLWGAVLAWVAIVHRQRSRKS